MESHKIHVPNHQPDIISGFGMIIPFPTEWKVIIHGSSHHQPDIKKTWKTREILSNEYGELFWINICDQWTHNKPAIFSISLKPLLSNANL
jgi:hypothetical protein